MMSLPKLHIAIPLMDELENIPVLIENIRIQTYKNYQVWICVNQPEVWHDDPMKIPVCERNAETIKYINSQIDFPIRLLDFSTKGNGWRGKKHGVGIARKVLMDSINKVADANDIIISLDGDTEFNPNYFQSIIANFNQNPLFPAISIPYYHRLTGNKKEDRAILRYEIYMRYYELNLRRIGSPYAFTALGSAMACKISAYRRIGGMTPKKSGEDFYFLQKLVKFKPILTKNSEWVYPAARFSDRVFFGTGPAMIKGDSGDWTSYPIYRWELFDEIKEAFDLFPILFKNDIETPIDSILGEGWAQKLRENCRSKEVFIKACHDKFDGLRTLQFLKENQSKYTSTDEENLLDFAKKFEQKKLLNILKDNFNTSTINELDTIRSFFLKQ